MGSLRLKGAYLSTSQPADLRPLGRPAWCFERPAAGWLGLIGCKGSAGWLSLIGLIPN
jgi:hypothetical protein